MLADRPSHPPGGAGCGTGPPSGSTTHFIGDVVGGEYVPSIDGDAYLTVGQYEPSEYGKPSQWVIYISTPVPLLR